MKWVLELAVMQVIVLVAITAAIFLVGWVSVHWPMLQTTLL